MRIMKEKKIKKQFKILKKHLIYFDNSASTFKPKSVVNAVNRYNQFQPVNSGRGVYKLEYQVTKLVDDARQSIAEFINANQEEIIFTKNTTEGINLVAQSYVAENLKKGDEIIISMLEHHSNFLPWLELEKQIGIKVVFVPLNKDNLVTAENFKKVLSERTKFVSLTLVSNVLGCVLPIKKITSLAHKAGAKVLVDMAQAVSHFSVDIKDMDCDFATFSGYKMFAPSGVGVLYGKKQLLDEMKPVTFGGGMVLSVEGKNIEYKDAPEKFEGGTLPLGSIIGLGDAVKFINKIGYVYIENKDRLLRDYLLKKLTEIKDVEIYNKSPDVAIVCFNLKGVHAHDAATVYDDMGICVRAGHHCAQPLMTHLKQIATVRVSLAFYNTFKEIDKFIIATKKIIDFFKQV